MAGRVLDVSIQKRFGKETPRRDGSGRKNLGKDNLDKDKLGKGTTSVVPSEPISPRALAPEGGSLDVAFCAPAGFTIIFGASGAGKTTLLNCVAGLASPETGRIASEDRTLFDSERRRNIPIKERKIGYVFQDLALFPHLTAEQNIAYGLAKLNQSERRSHTEAILQSFGIEPLRHRKPSELSGGERQRVALARALVTDPCVLLLDEPLAALDYATKSRILDDLRAWNETHRVPILYVTHSRDEVFALGERVMVLEHGKIIAQGSPHEVLSAPHLETVARLAGFENIFDCVVEAIHEDRGTMTCRLASSDVRLETPLVRASVGAQLRIGIRAGDVLLATAEPREISARNIIQGKVISAEQRDMIVIARVNCGVHIDVQLTLAARDALRLAAGREAWLVVKTHSCHLMSV